MAGAERITNINTMAFTNTQELTTNELGGGQHPSFISKENPTYLSSGPQTAHKRRNHGIGKIADSTSASGLSRDAPGFMKSNPYVPINANLSSKERNARLLNRTAQKKIKYLRIIIRHEVVFQK